MYILLLSFLVVVGEVVTFSLLIEVIVVVLMGAFGDDGDAHEVLA